MALEFAFNRLCKETDDSYSKFIGVGVFFCVGKGK